MSWLKWILAYLFDCVHPHTTWPRRNATGLVYICCIDCGRELPYSLKYMSIITRVGQNRKTWHTGSIATVSRVLISVIVLFNSGRAAAEISNDYANEIGVSAHTQSDTAPTLVIGFVGGFVHGDDLRRLEVQLARRLQARQGSQPHADSDLQESTKDSGLRDVAFVVHKVLVNFLHDGR